MRGLRERVEELESQRNVHRRTFRWAGVVVGFVCLFVLVLGSSVAISDPSESLECEHNEFFCFKPNTPASADDVNHNFERLVAWIEDKVGDVDTTDVVAQGNISAASGSISAASGSISGTLTVNGDSVNVTNGDVNVTNGIVNADRVSNIVIYGSGNPLGCLAKCQERGWRMALLDEVFAQISSGMDYCTNVWMINGHNQQPVRGNPMYHNQTAAGCGSQSTGNIPRFENINAGTTWSDTESLTCVCAKVF